ncbi:MAG: glycosyltransferase [Candidatus Shapirobacteria bacterium]|nr:glycosyltransferase [Candidatus Shapirobacteria bacterium]MDD4410449.1 glycosyltransferase [Candidatus Shapirobacteria bacterium]
MKIAIYYNLEKGGALNSIIESIKFLRKYNKIDVYCFQKNISKKLVNNFFIYNFKKTNNIFQDLFQIIFELKKINKNIAQDIDKNNYDLVLIHPCLLTQSPYILRFLKNEKNIYFFQEPKREFYEQTSFDYWSIKKIITRLIRLPIKYIDKKNCKSAKNIISNSIFTANNLLKNYKKSSTIIYPGLKPITPKKITIKNNKKILSVGLFSKLKGHDFSIEQLNNIVNKITILGRETNESQKIFNLAKQNNISLNIAKTENNKEKDNYYKNYSIYLANNQSEPFGITTLESTSNNCLVLGKNEGGTPEIIKNGINGYLYSDVYEAKKILKQILSQKELTFYQINTIDWKYTTNKILEYYNRHINHD